MKTKLLLSIFLLSAGVQGFCTTWTITSVGTTFSPNAITINLGDSVLFVLASMHNSQEVSQATWNANGSTALPGGWSTPFSGGLVLPAFLTQGTHYYVCVPHAAFGMKGTIDVNNPNGVGSQEFHSLISFCPNPSNGKFNILFGNPSIVIKYNVDILDMQGQSVLSVSNCSNGSPVEIDLEGMANGIYLVRITNDMETFTEKILIQ